MILGIVPDAHDLINRAVDAMSIRDLLLISDLSELSNFWNTLNNIRYDTGRLLIGKTGGSIWSKATIPRSDEWTVEFVFRSSGIDKDLAFGDNNGLSLFLVEDKSSDTQNFGGPDKFDGFQLLINTRDKQGLKIFANDGTKKLDNNLGETIGDCQFIYLNSQVPFNMRVSYSEAQSVFKVQIDNNLCFKTDKIKIPGKLRLGVAGNVSPASEEMFEILKLKTWDYLTEDAIDDHGLMSDGELKIAYKTVVEDHNQISTPAQIRESLLEKNRRFKEQLSKETNEFDRSITFDSSRYEEIIQQNNRLQSRLDSLETLLLNLQRDGQVVGNDKTFENFQNTITTQYAELLESIARLNQKVISEVREQQFTIDELGKKVDLLMNHHKEIKFQNDKPINTYEAASNTIRYILFVIVFIVLLLAVFVYRLRHDIKHSKLL